MSRHDRRVGRLRVAITGRVEAHLVGALFEPSLKPGIGSPDDSDAAQLGRPEQEPPIDPSSGVQAVVAGPGWAIDPRWHAVVDAHASPPYRRASVGAVRLSSMWRRNRTDVPDPSRSGVERMASLSERWTQQPSASGSTAAAGSPTAAR